MTSIQIPKIRHLRHGLNPIQQTPPRRRKLLAWLATQVTKFGGTGTTQTITAVNTTDSAAASGTFTFTGTPSQGDTVTIDGKVYEFVNSLNEFSLATQCLIAGSANAAAQSLRDAIQRGQGNDGDNYLNAPSTPNFDASVSTNVVTITAADAGTNGNAISLAESSTAITVSGATLAGGTDGNTLTDTAHGMADGDGPHLIASTLTLPGGLDGSIPYYIGVVDANTIQLFLSQDDALLGVGDGKEVDITSAGTGTITLDPEVSDQSIIEHIRDGALPRVMEASTDIDDFA